MIKMGKITGSDLGIKLRIFCGDVSFVTNHVTVFATNYCKVYFLTVLEDRGLTWVSGG